MFGKKVNKIDVYLGTIKKCLNINDYNEYGETKFVPFTRINHMVEGSQVSNVEVVNRNVILVRMNQFMYTEYENGKIKENIPIYPEADGENYVDERTLVPFFKEKVNPAEKINIKKLKR